MDIHSILIVDDSESDHFLTQDVIEDFDPNISILHAYDGQEALDILEKLTQTGNLVILLDINMPGMNGLEFLEEYAKCDYSSVVVTMLTSSEQETDKKTSLAYPFVKNYFVKPLDESDLLQIKNG